MCVWAMLVLTLACSKDTSLEDAEIVCTAGEYSCQVRTLRICNDSRTGWIEVDRSGLLLRWERRKISSCGARPTALTVHGVTLRSRGMAERRGFT